MGRGTGHENAPHNSSLQHLSHGPSLSHLTNNRVATSSRTDGEWHTAPGTVTRSQSNSWGKSLKQNWVAAGKVWRTLPCTTVWVWHRESKRQFRGASMLSSFSVASYRLTVRKYPLNFAVRLPRSSFQSLWPLSLAVGEYSWKNEW